MRDFTETSPPSQVLNRPTNSPTNWNELPNIRKHSQIFEHRSNVQLVERFGQFT